MSRFCPALALVLVCRGLAPGAPLVGLITDVDEDSVTVLVKEQAPPPPPPRTVPLARDARVSRLKDADRRGGHAVEHDALLSDLQDALDSVNRPGRSQAGRRPGVFGFLKVTDGTVTEVGYYAGYQDTGGFYRSAYGSKLVLITDVTEDSITFQRTPTVQAPRQSRRTFPLAAGARVNRMKDSADNPDTTVRRRAEWSDLQDAIDYVKRGKGMGVEGVLQVRDGVVTQVGFYPRFDDTGAYFWDFLQGRKKPGMAVPR